MRINRAASLFLRTTRRFSQHKHEYSRSRKAKTKVIEKYPGIPLYRQQVVRDPFDYQLSSKSEVDDHISKHLLNLPFEIEMDFGYNSTQVVDEKFRKCQVELNVKYLHLSPMQMQRLVFLVGDRYKEKTGQIRIVCRSFGSRDENLMRCLEIYKELIMETLRAPFQKELELFAYD